MSVPVCLLAWSWLMNCPTVYCRAFSVGNLVADIPLANGRMPDHGWPRVNSRRYTLGYLLSRLYMLMTNSIKTLGYYSDSSSVRILWKKLEIAFNFMIEWKKYKKQTKKFASDLHYMRLSPHRCCTVNHLQKNREKKEGEASSGFEPMNHPTLVCCIPTLITSWDKL